MQLLARLRCAVGCPDEAQLR